MNRKAILYKGIWLDPNSQAYRLHQEKKFKELDQHMAEVDRRAAELEGRPPKGKSASANVGTNNPIEKTTTLVEFPK